jgi:hypothetical protein
MSDVMVILSSLMMMRASGQSASVKPIAPKFRLYPHRLVVSINAFLDGRAGKFLIHSTGLYGRKTASSVKAAGTFAAHTEFVKQPGDYFHPHGVGRQEPPAFLPNATLCKNRENEFIALF